MVRRRESSRFRWQKPRSTPTRPVEIRAGTSTRRAGKWTPQNGRCRRRETRVELPSRDFGDEQILAIVDKSAIARFAAHQVCAETRSNRPAMPRRAERFAPAESSVPKACCPRRMRFEFGVQRESVSGRLRALRPSIRESNRAQNETRKRPRHLVPAAGARIESLVAVRDSAVSLWQCAP